MGKRGPKRMPVELKLAAGTHRADRDGNLIEIEPVSPFDLAAPESLGAIGKRVWGNVAPKLAKLGVLAEIDLAALETYCRSFDEIAASDAVLKKEGDTYTTEKGAMGPHPHVAIRFKWLEIKRRYESEFGLTASARSSLSMNVEKPKAKAAFEPRKRG